MANKTGNTQNLIPQAHTLTSEECSKGGKISGEVRKRKKQLRDDLITLLETGDTQKEICVALIQEALNGNVKAFNTIRDTIGETVPNKIEKTVKMIN